MITHKIIKTLLIAFVISVTIHSTVQAQEEGKPSLFRKNNQESTIKPIYTRKPPADSRKSGGRKIYNSRKASPQSGTKSAEGVLKAIAEEKLAIRKILSDNRAEQEAAAKIRSAQRTKDFDDRQKMKANPKAAKKEPAKKAKQVYRGYKKKKSDKPKRIFNMIK